MNWNDLRFVLAVAKHKTLTRAADQLGGTHTTVARRLQALEESLGTRLFDQTPEGYVLTEAGQTVFEAAVRIEAETQQIETRLLGGDEKLGGKLRVSTMDILFRRYKYIIASFLQKYPGIELTISTTDSETSLTRREADVVLRMTNSPPSYLVGRKVAKVEFAIYAAKSLVDRIGENAPLNQYPWLHWDERLNARWLDDWLSVHAPNAAIAIRCDLGSTGLREAVKAGLGVHFLATFEGDSDPSLVRISPIQDFATREVWLLTLAEYKNTSRVRAFIDHLAQQIPLDDSPSQPTLPWPNLLINRLFSDAQTSNSIVTIRAHWTNGSSWSDQMSCSPPCDWTNWVQDASPLQEGATKQWPQI